MVRVGGPRLRYLSVSFALSVLSGAIFPFPLSQILVSTGETCGSSLCYLLSSAIAKPILEYLAADKLVAMHVVGLAIRVQRGEASLVLTPVGQHAEDAAVVDIKRLAVQ